MKKSRARISEDWALFWVFLSAFPCTLALLAAGGAVSNRNLRAGHIGVVREDGAGRGCPHRLPAMSVGVALNGRAREDSPLVAHLRCRIERQHEGGAMVWPSVLICTTSGHERDGDSCKKLGELHDLAP